MKLWKKLDAKKLIGVTIDANHIKYDNPITKYQCDEALYWLIKHGCLHIRQHYDYLPQIHFTNYTYGVKEQDLGYRLDDFIEFKEVGAFAQKSDTFLVELKNIFRTLKFK